MWFRARNQDFQAKMFVTENDEGLSIEKISVWRKDAADNPISMNRLEQLETYGFDIPALKVDIYDWFENERESQENFS